MKETRNDDTSTSTTSVFETLRQEALDFEMTDKFLASVEQKNRLYTGAPFDAGRLHEALKQLAANETKDEEIDIENAELIAESEIGSWREILELRNSKIETYHIRRFCDNSEMGLDLGLLVSLARVFRSLPYSESNQSKYDLVVTRLFTKGNVETMRNLRLPREKVEEALAAILPIGPECGPEMYVESSVEDFYRFMADLKPLSDIEEFVERDSFEVLRQYKRGLGKLFFHPRVTAAAIECNITIGNVFAGLVNQVNGPMYELINNKFDFAGAFHDVSPSSKTGLWDEFSSAEDEDEAASPLADREQIRELLEMIGGHEKTVIPPDEEIRELALRGSDTGENERSAGERVNEILKRLSSENPDYDAIRGDVEKYEVLKSLDLEYLLEGKSETLNEFCRDVLAVIIWTEELCANELQGTDQLSEKSKSEAATLIQLSEKYQKELQKMIEDDLFQDQNRLLTISNKLLASHLDLKALLVRYTGRNLAVAETKKKERIVEEIAPKKKKVEPISTNKATGGGRKWLAAALILIAIMIGIVYITNRSFTATANRAMNIEYLNVVSLPDGRYIKSAVRQHNKLTITAKDEWAMRTVEEQKATLRKLFSLKSKEKVDFILVTDGLGRPLGNVSAYGLSLGNPEKQNAEKLQ